MDLTERSQTKKVFALALVSVVASVLFSFLGAPFLRAFSVSTRSRVFWPVAILLVGGLFLFGMNDYKISQAAIFVGAIWMTLGSYNELEVRGIQWKRAMSLSLLAGILLAGVGYLLVTRQQPNSNLLEELIKPIQETINKSFPENPIEASVLIGYVPGIFVACLFASLALGFSLESRVVSLFQIQKFKVASALRWLDFRLPDLFVWASLFALLFSEINFGQKILQVISVNLLIVAAVAYFFQGITVIEFLMRFYRFGTITRMITYVLIFFQLPPFVVFVGFIDYWIDFRKIVRQKAKLK